MFQKKYYLYLSQSDFRVLLQSLVQMKNRLIREGRFADCVDELIQKVITAHNHMRRICVFRSI